MPAKAFFSAVLSKTPIVCVARQPVAVTLYVIVTDPVPIPVTTPEPEPMDAMDGVLLVHVPPVVVFERVVVVPVVNVVAPVMAAGDALMVMVAVLKHPVPSEYVTVAVPADMPVTTPVDESIVAFEGLLQIQVPPGVTWLSVVVAPTHTLNVPVIAAVAAFTVT